MSVPDAFYDAHMRHMHAWPLGLNGLLRLHLSEPFNDNNNIKFDMVCFLRVGPRGIKSRWEVTTAWRERGVRGLMKPISTFREETINISPWHFKLKHEREERERRTLGKRPTNSPLHSGSSRTRTRKNPGTQNHKDKDSEVWVCNHHTQQPRWRHTTSRTQRLSYCT